MKTTFLFFLTFFCAFNARAQWVESGGPLGGMINLFAKSSNNKLWAATERGLYYSITDGSSWILALENSEHCTNVIASGDTVLATYYVFIKDTTNNNIDYFHGYSIMSINNGTSWGVPNDFYYDNAPVRNAVINKIGNKISVFDMQIGQFETANLGQTWNIPLTAIPGSKVQEVMYNKNTAFHEERSNPPFAKVYRCVSFDAKTSWAYIDSSDNGNLKAIGATGNAIIFLADTVNPKILRSTNLGINMDTVLNLPNAFPNFTRIFNHRDTLYLVINDTAVNFQEFRLYKSIDLGITWNAMPPNASALMWGRFSLLNTGEYVYGYGLVYNMMKYSPVTDSSFVFNNSIKSQNIQKLVSTGNDLYGQSSYHIFRSTDDGVLWEDLPYFNKSMETIYDLAAKGDTLAALTFDSVLISFDKGTTWIAKENTGNFRKIFIHGNLLFAQHPADSPSHSTNWANSWTTSPIQGGLINGSHQLVNDNDTAIYDFVFYTGWLSHLYKYNVGTQQFEFLGNTNIDSIGTSRKITKQGNVWFNYGEAADLLYSYDGLHWNISNTAAIPLSPYPNPYTGQPTFVNGVFYSHYGDTTLIYSGNMGTTWNVVPGNNNNLNFLKFWNDNEHEELVSHKGILYMPTFFKSVWRRSDTIKAFTGTIYYDANNNSVKDVNEIYLQNVIAYTPSAFSNSNMNGQYGLITDQVGDSLKITLPNVAFNSNPDHIITSLSQLNNNDFGVVAPNNISDFTVDATNVAGLNPAQMSNITIHVENLATANQTSVVTFLLDPLFTYQNAIPPPTSINGNLYTWNLPALAFTQHQSINISVQLDFATPLGTAVQCISSVTPANADMDMTNNIDTLNAVTVAAFDPNDKTCKQGDQYTIVQLANNEALEYIIRFQNTGNAPASFVNIEDTLSELLDLSTFKVLNASHAMTYELKGKGAIKFILNPINLPAAVQNEPASHGFVKYSIQAKKGVAVGNVISNTAFIYFDFNAPVVTNTTNTEIVYPSQVLGIDDDIHAEVFKNSILIYPNPASNSFFINFNKLQTGSGNKLTLYDLKGSQMMTQMLSQEINNINTENLIKGLYIGIITDTKNHKVSTFKIEIDK